MTLLNFCSKLFTLHPLFAPLSSSMSVKKVFESGVVLMNYCQINEIILELIM